MTKYDLLVLLQDLPDDAEVAAKFADLGEGGNVTSPIIRVGVDLDDSKVGGKIILITDHTI